MNMTLNNECDELLSNDTIFESKLSCNLDITRRQPISDVPV